MTNSMQDFVVLFVVADVVIIIAVLFFVFQLNKRKKLKLKEALEHQAQKRHGEVEVKRFGWYPLLKIPFHGQEVLLWMMPGGKNSPPHTYVACPLTVLSDLKVTIYRESTFSQIGKIFGFKEIQINNPQFDEAFMIRGNDEMRVMGLLDHTLQQSLLVLKEYDPVVTIKNNSFQIVIPKFLESDRELDLLLDSAFIFLNKIVEFQ